MRIWNMWNCLGWLHIYQRISFYCCVQQASTQCLCTYYSGIKGRAHTCTQAITHYCNEKKKMVMGLLIWNVYNACDIGSLFGCSSGIGLVGHILQRKYDNSTTTSSGGGGGGACNSSSSQSNTCIWHICRKANTFKITVHIIIASHWMSFFHVKPFEGSLNILRNSWENVGL